MARDLLLPPDQWGEGIVYLQSPFWKTQASWSERKSFKMAVCNEIQTLIAFTHNALLNISTQLALALLQSQCEYRSGITIPYCL